MSTASMPVVERGMPLPKYGNRAKWPWRDLGVGDSFMVSAADARSVQMQASITGKRLGIVLRTRRLPDGSMRVWRVA